MRNEVKYDPINGKTIQVSDTNTDYTIGDWVAGIDDTAGYVIVSDTTTLNAVGSGTGGGLGDPAGANMPVFWQSTGRTDGALIDLINKMDKDNNILTYSYNKLASINSEWKDLNLNLIDVKISNVNDIGNYIESIDKIDSENRFWRCDHSLEYDHEDCILPLLKYNLFYKIAVS